MTDFSKPYALDSYFGNIDIYLFDQLLKGRIHKGQRILDAGCGGGRNLIFMFRQGFDVFGIDQQLLAVSRTQSLADDLAPDLPSENFRVEAVEKMSFPDAFFDVVISSAVLHFAENEQHFDQMLKEMWRVLKKGGIFFARLASDIGIESKITPLGNRRFRLGDGTERFLVNEKMLQNYVRMLNANWIEPLKTVNVSNIRCMTTCCLKKNH